MFSPKQQQERDRIWAAGWDLERQVYGVGGMNSPFDFWQSMPRVEPIAVFPRSWETVSAGTQGESVYPGRERDDPKSWK